VAEAVAEDSSGEEVPGTGRRANSQVKKSEVKEVERLLPNSLAVTPRSINEVIRQCVIGHGGNITWRITCYMT